MQRPFLTTRPIKELQNALADGALTLPEVWADARAAIRDHNPLSRFLTVELPDEPGAPQGGLAGLPVTVKDLFDLAGVPTTCGSRFYAAEVQPPWLDAGYPARWRQAGARFIGKTILNEFAYGITGENPWFGDCTIPGHADRLTGGSSSGAAASVAAGAACVALGTDTGGSLRVPAALCGLASFRQSLGFGEIEGMFPLAPTYDTVGWLQRHLGDLPLVASLLHPERPIPPLAGPPRIASLTGPWLAGVAAENLAAQAELEARLRSAGASVETVRAGGWEGALDIYVPLQAADAAAIHARFLPRHAPDYDPAVLARLDAGARLTPDEVLRWRSARASFVADCVTPLFGVWDYLLAPASAVTHLVQGEDQSGHRPRLLRLTAPASLGGLPVLTVPLHPGVPDGAGFQFLTPRGADASLWALAGWLAERLA